MAALYVQCGNAHVGFLPQSLKSHAKDKLQRILRMLGRAGLKLGGEISDKKMCSQSGWPGGSTES
eukprot:3523348-Pyramimonas_sp.AAC.1